MPEVVNTDPIKIRWVEVTDTDLVWNQVRVGKVGPYDPKDRLFSSLTTELQKRVSPSAAEVESLIASKFNREATKWHFDGTTNELSFEFEGGRVETDDSAMVRAGRIVLQAIASVLTTKEVPVQVWS